MKWRGIVACTLGLTLALAARLPVQADPHHPDHPVPPKHLAPVGPPQPVLRDARNAGEIDGRIETVDYRANRIVVEAHGRSYAVNVLPSTTIHSSGGGFHTIADLTRGGRIHVFLSERDGVYSAQIIDLR
ncbi:MAG: hypothetical protein ACREM2_06535 [Vulcanimicrobiaceae bacterium]